MSQIRVLSDNIANQIAAGEVIERPAAVVKELIENSLDAGADRIEVIFRRGGISYLKITDNGSGMSEQEALLSLERHATSKLHKVEDLNAILSYGFRGEAIPSIASVSRFLLRTRRAEDKSGTEILVVGGKIQYVRECGMPQGTIIEVDRLFFNVPARRKFLKKEITEAGHIAHLIKLYALASPQSAFTLKEENRILYDLPPCPALIDRIGELFGRDLATQLRPLSLQKNNIQVEGYGGIPTAQKTHRKEIIFSVNQRPVESRTLYFAVIEAYQNHIPKGRYPVVFANLSIPPEAVDVNVHPTKREVRFRHEQSIREIIIQSVWELLDSQNTSRLYSSWDLPQNPDTGGKHSGTLSPLPSPPSIHAFLPVQKVNAAPLVTPPAYELPSSQVSKLQQVPSPSTQSPLPQLDHWKFLGKLEESRLLFSHNSGLTLVHEQTAQKRIAYEEVLSQMENQSLPIQTLIFPLPLELTSQESSLLKGSLHFFNQFGIHIEEFGKSWFRITAIPAIIPQEQAEHLIRTMLSWMEQTSSKARAGREGHEWIARTLSSASVTTSTTENEEQAFTLLHRLLSCNHPMLCPQGNPTLIEITKGELQRRFHPQASGRAVLEE